jgi:hypothetical protein
MAFVTPFGSDGIGDASKPGEGGTIVEFGGCEESCDPAEEWPALLQAPITNVNVVAATRAAYRAWCDRRISASFLPVGPELALHSIPWT